ncbi:MAG: hypothetical protein JW940_07980 [Polyangiaceae bacterium]|nr:hypothetical protein [Polyangiaceae bacterium]
MRRTSLVAVFLGVLVLVLGFYLVGSKHGVGRSEGEPRVDHPRPATGAPRVAVSLPALRRPSAFGRRDAGIDAGSSVLDEQPLMEKARAALGTDPALAEALAREGRARFQDSPASDERDFIVVMALRNQLNLEGARSEAFYYFAHHPNGRYVESISRSLHMGIPHR